MALSSFEYLEEVLNFRPSSNPDKFESVLAVMERYSEKGDTWWLKYRNEPEKLVARQLLEPVLLIPISTLIKGLTIVLGRTPKREELTPMNKDLLSEFSKKYKSYQSESSAY